MRAIIFLLILVSVSVELSAQRKKEEKKTLHTYDKLKLELENIYDSDQHYRLSVDSVIKKYGIASLQMQYLDSMIGIADSINLNKATSIIKKYGWVSDSVMGKKASTALWLVIQHSDSSIQKKYLPIITQAVKDGKEKPINLAFLVDRMLSDQGKEQLYGTQSQYDDKGNLILLPIQDINNLNKRRENIGLPPLKNISK